MHTGIPVSVTKLTLGLQVSFISSYLTSDASEKKNLKKTQAKIFYSVYLLLLFKERK